MQTYLHIITRFVGATVINKKKANGTPTERKYWNKITSVRTHDMQILTYSLTYLLTYLLIFLLVLLLFRRRHVFLRGQQVQSQWFQTANQFIPNP